jgi:ribonuclease Z
MEMTFLGTSSGSPTRQRNVTGLALRHAGRWDLFDCGEGTQHQLLRTKLSLSKLDRVFISHLHGDHCFGLFGLLGSRSMDASTGPLAIFGPPGLRTMIDTVLKASATHLNYPLDVHEVSPGGGRVVDEDADGHGSTIDAIPLTHRVTSFAWSLHERDRPGAFDVDAARAAGVPAGPLFGRLQAGKPVVLDDGRTVTPDDLIGPVRPGRRIVIAGDNSAPMELLVRTPDADVVVHEATYTEPVLAALGSDHGHSTAARVAHAAAQHGVRNLVLTHFSPRYADAENRSGETGTSGVQEHRGAGLTIDDVRNEARQHFAGNLHLARDFDRFEIAHDGSSIRLI